MNEPLIINPTITIPATEIAVEAVRSSGPGGQNVNKVSSKIELRFDLTSTQVIPENAKERLKQMAKNKLDAEGKILITSQKTRDQLKNLLDAREKLKDLICKSLLEPKPRKATKPSRGAVEHRLREKHRTSERKTQRHSLGE